MVIKYAADLQELVTTTLVAAGSPPHHAEIVAKHLVGAEACGVQTHGIFQIPGYLQNIRDGLLVPTNEPEVISDQGNCVHISGNVGWGHVAAEFATSKGIEKTSEHGMALIGLVRCNHIGRLGHFVEMAAAAGIISFIWDSGICSNARRVAPFAGRDRTLDVNPIAIGVPAAQQPPIIIDYATSGGSFVKVMNAQRRHETLSPGAIVDKQGQPSVDPNDYYDGGALAPFGGHKGYSLMVATEMLGRIFAAADDHARDGEGTEDMRHQGVTFMMFRADLFGSQQDFEKRVDQSLKRIVGSRPAAGFDKVRYPGQKEAAARTTANTQGISIADDVWEQFVKAAKTVDVIVP